jgi:hypothetical protein
VGRDGAGGEKAVSMGALRPTIKHVRVDVVAAVS